MCSSDLGKGVADGAGASEKSHRHSKTAYEKAENRASASRARGTPSPLQATIEKLATPVDPGADPALAQAQLEEQRELLLLEAKEVSRAKLDIDMMMREYNKANGFKPVTPRVDTGKNNGKNLDGDFAKVAKSSSVASILGSYTSAERPMYSSPAKNLRAALAAAEELPHLSGEALLKQQARLNKLLSTANKMNDKMAKANPVAGGSQVIYSAGGAGGKSDKQASSPNHRPRRDPSVNSGRRSREMQPYDLAVAGKQHAGNNIAGNGDAGNRSAGQGGSGGSYAGNGDAGRRANSADGGG